MEKENAEVFDVDSGALIVPGDYLPEIPKDTVDQVCKDAEEVVLWAKPTPGGFMVNDQLIPEIVGIITGIDAYWVRWTDNMPDKLHSEEAPEDYEKRCDVIVTNHNGQRLGISLAQSSYKFQFAPYVKALEGMQLSPGDVISKFKCKEVTGKYGTFVIVPVTNIGQLKKSEFSDYAEQVNSEFDAVETDSITEDDIPF